MKSYFIFLAMCIMALTGKAQADHHHHDHAYKFSIHQINYKFSSVFELESHGKPHGCVVKSYLRWLKPVRDSYDVYNEAGEWTATGISRVFCLGLFRAWGAEFDIYNKDGEKIGLIDGQVMTTEAAKYSIYNAKGDRVAIAYLDNANSGISIVHPERTTHLIARFTWESDHMHAAIYDAEAVHPAIIKVFAGFVHDYKHYFK